GGSPPWSLCFARRALGAALSAARQKVDVDVIHDLAAFGPTVDPEPISALGQSPVLTDLACSEEAAAENLDVPRLHRGDRSDMAFGDDEKMDRRLRVDVLEGEDRIVLVVDLRMSLTGDDAAEHALAHRASLERLI